MFEHQGHVFVGQAMGHIKTASDARVAQRTPEQDLQMAGRAVGRAYKFFLMAGLTQAQAVDRIVSLAQSFGSLE
jgi:hypothetical protein